MNTLTDITLLLLAYAGISLGCSVLLWSLRAPRNQANFEQATSRGW